MAQGQTLIARDNTDLSKGSTNQGQPGYPVPPSQYMSPNSIRDLFLQTAIYRSIVTDPIAYTAGNTIQIKVPQTGFANKIVLYYALSVSSAAALTAAPTAKAPYSIVSQVLYNDPSGNVRVNSAPYHLQNLMLSKKTNGFDIASALPNGLAADAVTGPLVFNNPTPGVAAANVRAFVDIPITMSDFDTRGGMLLESATSPSFLQVVANPLPMDTNASASIESPYTNNAAATTLTLTGTLQPVYYFWQPSYIRGPHGAVLPIPTDDLNMVHEIITQRNSNVLNANTDNKFTLPTGRSYYRLLGTYVNNNGLGGAAAAPGVANVKFAYDSANFTLNETLQAYLSRIRRDVRRDLPRGTYLWDWSARPWDSNHYGQLDAILTFDGTALTNPYIDYTRDCLYQAPLA